MDDTREMHTPAASSIPDHAILFTPGPGNLDDAVRAALSRRDWGSRDDDFRMLTRRVIAGLSSVLGDHDAHTCVPLPGSGTGAVEAAITSLLPRDAHVLVVINGAYGERVAEIVTRSGRPITRLGLPFHRAVPTHALAQALSTCPAITHVALVHVETTAGVLNPLGPLIDVCAAHGKRVFVDAMSSFGALPMPSPEQLRHVDAIVSSANKCLQGAPGVAFVFAAHRAIESAAGNASTLSLDLHSQWDAFRQTGEWRFTPPTHVIAALDAALGQLWQEGGPTARWMRYQALHDLVCKGMQALGFPMLVPEQERAPVIATFGPGILPDAALPRFLGRLRDRGFVVYAGKLPATPCFRIGFLGAIHEGQARALVDAAARILEEHSWKTR